MPALRSIRKGLVVLCGLLFAGAAFAGSGPWTLGPGERNVYIGGDYYRFSEFKQGGGSAVTLPVGITAGSLTGVGTLGLAWGLEFEGKIGFEGVRTTNPNEALCSDSSRPKDWCTPTANVGDLAANLKWRFLDEARFSPVSTSASLAIRSGETYANTRRRYTTLGPGTTDLGASLAVGRTARLGKGFYAVSGTGWYWLVLPNRSEQGTKVPADEVDFEAELLVSLHPRFGFGPAVNGFSRLGGVDFFPAQTDFMDFDVWNRLQAQQVRVGGKLGVWSMNGGPTVSVTVLQTVAARNSPSDTLAVSVGLGWFTKPQEREPLPVRVIDTPEGDAIEIPE